MPQYQIAVTEMGDTSDTQALVRYVEVARAGQVVGAVEAALDIVEGKVPGLSMAEMVPIEPAGDPPTITVSVEKHSKGWNFTATVHNAPSTWEALLIERDIIAALEKEYGSKSDAPQGAPAQKPD